MPEWYPEFVALARVARILNCTVMEAAALPHFWMEWALMALSAEEEAADEGPWEVRH